MSAKTKFELRVKKNGSDKIWRVTPTLNRIEYKDRQVSLQPRVMAVLEMLVDARGELVTKDALVATVWDGRAVVDAALTRAVSSLRKAFGHVHPGIPIIETISKRGYRLLADINVPNGVTADYDPIVLGILPFNVSDNDISFADSISQELIAQCSRQSDLSTISWTSMRSCRNSSLSVPQLATKLKMTHILESRIDHQKSHARVVSQLIDARTDNAYWSTHCVVDRNDAISGPIQAAHSILLGLLTVLLGKNVASGPIKDSQELNKAKYFWRRRSKQNDQKTLSLLRTYLKMDPENGAACAMLANCLTVLAIETNLPAKESYLEAKELALKALEIDPNYSEALASLGSIQLLFEWQLCKADRSFERALGIDPSDAETILSHAEVYSARGQHSRAALLAEEACRLNPLDASYHTNRALIYTFAQEFSKAALAYEVALELTPSSRTLVSLAKVLVRAGALSRAREIIDQKLAREPGNEDLLSIIHSDLGDIDTANQYFEHFDRLHQFDVSLSYRRARVLTCLNKLNAAYRSWRIAADHRLPWVVFTLVDPFLQPLLNESKLRDDLTEMELRQHLEGDNL